MEHNKYIGNVQTIAFDEKQTIIEVITGVLAIIAIASFFFIIFTAYTLATPVNEYVLNTINATETFINEETTPVLAVGNILIVKNVSSFVDLPDDVVVVNITGNLTLVDSDRNVWRGHGAITYSTRTYEVRPGEKIMFTSTITIAPSYDYTLEAKRKATTIAMYSLIAFLASLTLLFIIVTRFTSEK